MAVDHLYRVGNNKMLKIFASVLPDIPDIRVFGIQQISELAEQHFGDGQTVANRRDDHGFLFAIAKSDEARAFSILGNFVKKSLGAVVLNNEGLRYRFGFSFGFR